MEKNVYVLILFTCLGIARCTGPAPSDPDRYSIFTDDLGRRVTVPDSVQRIVTLAPSMTEIIIAAGAGDRIVGVTTADDNPRLPDSITRFSALPVDFEAITALQPDLVVATSQINSPRDAETLRTLGIPTIFFSFPSVYDIPRVIETLGTLLNTQDQAAAAANSMRRQLHVFRSRTDTLSTRPRVLFLISDAPLYSFGGDSYVNEMIALAGGQSVTDSLNTKSPVLSDEFVLNVRPQVIIGTFGENYKLEELLALHPTWKLLPAVQQKRVYSIPPDWVVRPTPRVIDAIRYMTALLHPSLVDSSLASAPHP